MTLSILTSAKLLTSYGLQLFPCHPRSKYPAWKGWKARATADLLLLEKWFTRHPDDNLSILTGRRSGVMALDIDRRNGGDVSFTALEQQHPALPPTWQYRTDDGFRLLFRVPEGVTVLTDKLRPGIDVLGGYRNGTGANCVAPPSVHESGTVYTWMDCYDPASVPLAEMPLWLIDELREKGLLCSSVVSKGVAPRAGAPPTSLLTTSPPLPSPPPIVGPLSSQQVSDLFRDWQVIQRCLPLLGLSHVTKAGESFHCILHPEQHPSAAIAPPKKPGEHFMYADFHHGETEPLLLPLPLVYYCLMTGAPASTRLPKPSFLVWSIRLLRDAGVIAGFEVQAPTLRGAVPAHVQRVYEVFVDLLRCKWRHQPHAPTVFAWGFVRAWTGQELTERQVSAGIKWLLGYGYLRVCKVAGRMSEFLLGTRELIRQRRRRLFDRGWSQSDVIEAVLPDTQVMLQQNEVVTTLSPEGEEPISEETIAVLYALNERLKEKRRLYG